MTKQQIMDLQTQLNQQFGANLKVDGIWGPKTEAAYQNSLGINKSASGGNNAVLDLQKKLNAQGAGLKEDGIWGPKTQSAYESFIANESANIKATENANKGMPFSEADRQAAFDESMVALNPYYQAQAVKDTADTESTLGSELRNYEDFLRTSGQDFQKDKTNLDQNAADQGVLFSGSRVQKERNLAKDYEAKQAKEFADTAANIGNTARDYQYNYGNKAAGGLAGYFNLGKNTYNPKVSTGGVNMANLSSVYDTQKYNFQGVKKNEQKAEAEKRAAGLLWNKANKIVPYGYQNQY